MKFRPTEVWIEVRKCPACLKLFKAHPNSKAIYDSRICGDFDLTKSIEPLRMGVQLEVTVGVSTAKGPRGRKREIKFRASGKRI